LLSGNQDLEVATASGFLLAKADQIKRSAGWLAALLLVPLPAPAYVRSCSLSASPRPAAHERVVPAADATPSELVRSHEPLAGDGGVEEVPPVRGVAAVLGPWAPG
jgi:hypothetical protein